MKKSKTLSGVLPSWLRSSLSPERGDPKAIKTDSTFLSDWLTLDQTSSTFVPYREVPIFRSNLSFSSRLPKLNFGCLTRYPQYMLILFFLEM